MVEIVQVYEEIYNDLMNINKTSLIEHCGIFLGEFTRNKIKVVKYVQDTIKDDKTKSSTIRHTKGIYHQYQKFINLDLSIDYIGEWHTHLNYSSYPSYLDNQAMRTLLNHPLYSYPKKLILGIIGSNKLKVFLYKYRHKKSYELNLELIKI